MCIILDRIQTPFADTIQVELILYELIPIQQDESQTWLQLKWKIGCHCSGKRNQEISKDGCQWPNHKKVLTNLIYFSGVVGFFLDLFCCGCFSEHVDEFYLADVEKFCLRTCIRSGTRTGRRPYFVEKQAEHLYELQEESVLWKR